MSYLFGGTPFEGYDRSGRRSLNTGGGGGGNSGPTTSTTYTSNVPEWLRPQTEALLGAATQEYFNTQYNPETGKQDIVGVKPYVPYSANVKDYVADFSPLQQQVQYEAANMQRPGQFGAATDFATAAGMGGLESANVAYGYGAKGSAYGDLGAQLGTQGGQRFGEAGYQSGMLGQRLGTLGGAYYGGMGADYGAQAAQLSGAAQGYGQAGYQAGLRGEQTAGQYAQQSNAAAQQAAARGEQLANAYAQKAAQQGGFYGGQAAKLAPQAQGYGRTAADIGTMALEAQGVGRGITAQSQNLAARQAAAGDIYAAQATNPYAVQAYMSPYQQAVTDVQKAAAQREFDVASQARKAAAARTGAYGGARQAIEQAEATRNLNAQLQAIQATGSQSAYDKAIQSMQYGTGAGLQGLAGAQSGLGTALQGGQLGLSGIGQAIAGQQAGIAGLGQAGSLYGLGMQGAGMGLQAGQLGLAGTSQGLQAAQTGLQAGQLGLAGTGQAITGAQAGLSGIGQAGAMYGLGMQGAGVGLQGVQAQLAGTAQGMQGAQVGLQGVDRQLAGTAQGMQGAQVGLQGVQGAQAGYGLANQAGANLSNIGTAQQQADLARMQFQQQTGAAQQAQEQALINQAVQNYAMAQQYPYQQLTGYSGLLRGYNTPSTTVSQYSAAPNAASQIAGLGLTGAAMYGMAKKKGGVIREGDGLDDLGIYNAMKGAKK